MADLKDFKAKMDDFFKEAFEKADAGSFQKLAAVFSTYEGRFREDIQDMTRAEISRIIRKLQSEESLTDEERSVIELWIVGDARSFVKLEHKFKTNMEELKALQIEINRLCFSAADLETVSCLRAILEYGARLNYALASFLEKKERLDNFQQAMSTLDLDQREQLIDILKSKSATREV